MLTTPNMGLTAWDLEADPYDHSQLAANFTALDLHNHTPGKGVVIPGAGIQDGAIVTLKLADGSVTTAKIVDGNVTKAKLAADAISEKLGDMKNVYWPSSAGAYTAPTGWVVMMGQSLSAANHDFPGGGTVVLPDARNRFLLGAATSGTGTTPDLPPAIGATGGSNSQDLRHGHPVNPHQHSIPNHTHGLPGHTHTINDHSHNMSHNHWFYSPVGTEGSNNVVIMHLGLELSSGFNNMTNGDTGQILDSVVTPWAIALGSGTPIAAWTIQPQSFRRYRIQTSGSSAGNTGGSGILTTNSVSQSTNPAGATSDNDSGTATGNPHTGPNFGTLDLRPAYLGALVIVKVKN